MSRDRQEFNYYKALAFLDKKNRVKLCNNTYLVRRGVEGTTEVAVLLHSTDVITFKPNGDTVLCTGGWNSSTTWNRINSFQKHGVWSRRGKRVVCGSDGLEYLFNYDYYRGGCSITINAYGIPNGRPCYAETLQDVTGKECRTAEQMFEIIKGLDKVTVEKFMHRITLDYIIGGLCLKVFTGKDSIEESLSVLNAKQLWMVWRRGTYNMREKAESHLMPLLPSIDLDLAWSIWLRTACSRYSYSDNKMAKKLTPRLIKALPTLALTKIEKMWKSRGKTFIATYCSKDFLPLIIDDEKYRDIVTARLQQAA